MTSDQDPRPQILRESKDMVPVEGTVDVEVPIDVLWKHFTGAHLWAHWNKCFFWGWNRTLEKGKQLIWCFEPIRWWFPYKMPAIATIIEVEPTGPKRKVTWAVVALPGFYANHTYHMEDLGNGYTRFGSWEQAYGWSFRLMKFFWVNHFTFVKDRSLEGCRDLQQHYKRHDKLDETAVPKRSYLLFWLVKIAIVALIVLLATGMLPVAGIVDWIRTNWMYPAIAAGAALGALGIWSLWFLLRWVVVKPEKLADGVHVLLDGGGNSVVVEDDQKTLLIDTKFAPASRGAKRWIDHNAHRPVTDVINTHHHYDHTWGNVLYRDANIHAFAKVARFMKDSDPEFWEENSTALPTELMEGDEAEFKVGSVTLKLHLCGPAHTHADTWIHFEKDGKEFLFVNDLLFNKVFPFFDLDRHMGADIPGLVKMNRELAERFPNAVVIPGHGPMATADDLKANADFLEDLQTKIESAIDDLCTEDEAAKRIDLSRSGREKTPSRHHTLFPVWASAESCVRLAYRLVFDARAEAAQGVPPEA